LLIDGTERNAQVTEKLSVSTIQANKAVTRAKISSWGILKKILFLSPTKAGRYHDKKLFDKETSFRFIPPDRTLWLDKGFQGVQHHPKNVMMPKKKPKMDS